MKIDVREFKRILKEMNLEFTVWTCNHIFEATPKEITQTFVKIFNAKIETAGVEKFALPYNGKYPKLFSMDTNEENVIFGTEDYQITCNITENGPLDVFVNWNKSIENMKTSSVRGFKWIKGFPKNIFELPKRGTSKSAGYDIYVIHPKVFEFLMNTNMQARTLDDVWKAVVEADEQVVKCNKNGVIVLPTALKAYMQDDEFLLTTVRSGSGIKNGIQQANPPSVIDADYFENKDNDGHIYFAIRNKELRFDKPVMRIAQGVFMKYLIADNDNAKNIRIGGIGSTGDK